MYPWKGSQVSKMVSVFCCWKLVIFTLKAFVLPIGKNVARKALEHFAHVLMSSLLAQNHCFSLPTSENGNRRSSMIS